MKSNTVAEMLNAGVAERLVGDRLRGQLRALRGLGWKLLKFRIPAVDEVLTAHAKRGLLDIPLCPTCDGLLYYEGFGRRVYRCGRIERHLGCGTKTLAYWHCDHECAGRVCIAEET